MTKILNQFIRERDKATEEVKALRGQQEALIVKRDTTKDELNKLFNLCDDMFTGKTKMDAVKYLQGKADIVDKQRELEQAEANILEFDKLMENVEADIYNSVMEKFVLNGSLNTEHQEKQLELQRKMLKLLLDVSDVSTEMDNLSNEYKGAVQEIEHPKAQYYNFEYNHTRISLFDRFRINLKNGIYYSQHLTSELYPFEDGIIEG